MTRPTMPELPEPDETICKIMGWPRTNISVFDGEFARRLRELWHAARAEGWRARGEVDALACEAEECDEVTRAVSTGCAAAIRSVGDPEVKE